MDVPLLIKIEIREIANGVLLEMTTRPSLNGPSRVGPLFFSNHDKALDSAPKIARDALASMMAREESITAAAAACKITIVDAPRPE